MARYGMPPSQTLSHDHAVMTPKVL